MQLTPAQKLLLQHIKNHATKNVITLSHTQLANETGLHRTTIVRAIQHLTQQNIIQRIHQHNEDDGQTANLYRIPS